MMALYISPEEIIEVFVSSGGLVTNLQLVRHFGARLGGGGEAAGVNRDVLKRVTHHVATRRRPEAARDSTSLSDGGKLLVLKNRFRDKTVEDIWSSLILTLTKEEINKMLPIRIVEEVLEEIDDMEDNTDAPDNKDDIPADMPPVSRLSQLSVSDKTKSVRDLTKNFDSLAQTSSVSLTDHLSQKNRRELSKTDRRPAQQRPSSEADRFLPLTQEGRSWLKAAMRGDFQTLARLARTNPELTGTREPSTGYTALHWAGKLGSLEVVKLLAGTYMSDPDVRTRGGYTPLMLAALAKKHEVYDLLVNAYKADETLRDFSGKTSGQYLELHYPTIPGVTSRVDLSHDALQADYGGDDVDTSRKRRHVARAATHQFISEFRDSIRDIRGSFRDNWLRHKSLTELEK